MNDTGLHDDDLPDPYGEIRRERQQDAAEQRKAQRDAEARAAAEWWRIALAERRGRREIWKLIAVDLHAFEDRFVTTPVGFPSPEATWFQAGQQAAGLGIYQRLLMLDPTAVAVMHAENDTRITIPPGDKWPT